MNGFKINSNVPALSANRQALNNSKNLTSNIEKISSGLKINRGSDGPADLIISEILRGQTASLTQAISNNEISTAVAQTAEDAMNEANLLLVRMKQLAIHASNEGANDAEMLTADQIELENALDSLDRIAQFTQFGSLKLLDGQHSNEGLAVGEGLSYIEGGIKTSSSTSEGFNVIVNQVATKASFTSRKGLSQESIDDGEVLKIFENGKSIELVTNENDTVEGVIGKLNNKLKHQDMNVTVSLSGDNEITVTHKDFGSDKSFKVFSSSEGILSNNDGEVVTVENGTDVQGQVDGEKMEGKGEFLIGRKGTPMEGLQLRYTHDENAREITKPTSVGQIFFKQNSLRFQVGDSYGETVNYKLPSTYAESMGRNVANSSSYTNLRDLDLRSFQGAQDSLLLIEKAQNDLSLYRAELGAIQRNALEVNNRYLRAAKENIINSESIIRDTDMAEELTNFSRNKIKQETSMAMLAHANKNPRDILTLIQ